MMSQAMRKQFLAIGAVLLALFALYVAHQLSPLIRSHDIVTVSPESLRFSSDSSQLAYVESQISRTSKPPQRNQLRVWNLRDLPRILYTTGGLISRPQFSHDGKRVACICIAEHPVLALPNGIPHSFGMTARVWDVESGSVVGSYDIGAEPSVAGIWFTKDDCCLVTTGSSIRTIGIASGKTLHAVPLPGECMNAQFADKENVFSGTAMDDRNSDKIQFLAWNAATGKILVRFNEIGPPTLIPLQSPVKAVFEYGIGDACKHGSLTLINVPSGTRRQLADGLYTSAATDRSAHRIYLARSRPATTEDDCGVYGGNGTIIDALDASTGKVVWEAPVRENVKNILVSDDGESLITYGFMGLPDNSIVRMYNPETGVFLGTHATSRLDMEDASISPSGRLLATADDDRIQVFNIADKTFAPLYQAATSFGR